MDCRLSRARAYNAAMTLPLFTAADTRRLEAALARDHGLSPAALMQRAAQALHHHVARYWPDARRVLVVVGAGNNGGDGYVLARLLRTDGRDVQLLALVGATAEPARASAQAWRDSGAQTLRWSASRSLPAADLIVDALFGIGLRRPLEGAAAALVEAINSADVPVLAVDLPSGIDADTGAVAGIAVKATRTLSLLARKGGLYTGAAADHCGALDFDDLSVPNLPGEASGSERLLLQAHDLARWLQPRRRGAHKGEHGHVLVIGGDHGMAGAPRLAGSAALRAGAGFASVATRAAHLGQVGAACPELMVHGVEDAAALSFSMRRADVLAIGPGLGQGDWGRALLTQALTGDHRRVFDADALNLIAADHQPLPAASVITPHPGEAARLLGTEVAQIERDRFAAARELARRYRAVAVLKGAGTIIDDGERCLICPFGNPGMASAGMGDALTGIIAAMLAQRLPPFEAAAAGVLAHALAGDAAARDGGERGLLASDLIAKLRPVVNP